jgi:DNA-binding PadR family transcriptional regulator
MRPTCGDPRSFLGSQLKVLTTIHAWRIDYMCRTWSSGFPTTGVLMGMDLDRGTDKPLRPVEFHVLLSLAAGERHGYGIIQDIAARGETSLPDVGTMYRALARMVDTGLIEASARRPVADGDDERRNYYRITNAGLRVARAEARRLGTLMRAARLGGLLAKAVK